MVGISKQIFRLSGHYNYHFCTTPPIPIPLLVTASVDIYSYSIVQGVATGGCRGCHTPQSKWVRDAPSIVYHFIFLLTVNLISFFVDVTSGK